MGKKIKAVIFDQDGLMFDTERINAEAWKVVGEKYGVEVEEDFLRDLRGCKQDRVKEAFRERFGTEIDYDAFRAQKRQYSYDWVRDHGAPVKKGLKELLVFLKDKGIKTAVATASSEDWTQGNIKDAGLGSYFDAYVYGDMVKEAKPDPAIFLLAAGKLEEEPGSCLVLEDSFNGVKAGAAGGFPTVMVPDLAQPTPELKKLLTAECESLLDVIRLFHEGVFY